MSHGNIGAADGFLATIVEFQDPFWIVAPKITESDGTSHPNIKCITLTGLTPEVRADVMVVTIRNNHDGEFAPRYIAPSSSNGVIVGVKSGNAFTFTGDYTFEGPVTVNGPLTVNGQLTCDSLIVAGVDIGPDHQHAATGLISAAPGNPVTGNTGGVLP